MKETARENIASLMPKVIMDVETPYWEGLQQKKLRLQRCRDCGHIQFPPSKICTECTSYNVEWIEASGKGKLWSKVRFHKAYLKPYQDVPYGVSVVKLEEGPVVTGRLADEYVNQVQLDDDVEIEFYETADGSVTFGFRPVKNNEGVINHENGTR